EGQTVVRFESSPEVHLIKKGKERKSKEVTFDPNVEDTKDSSLWRQQQALQQLQRRSQLLRSSRKRRVRSIMKRGSPMLRKRSTKRKRKQRLLPMTLGRILREKTSRTGTQGHKVRKKPSTSKLLKAQLRKKPSATYTTREVLLKNQ
ncbi:unnamed protein product, partial [Cyprideis torosa]